MWSGSEEGSYLRLKDRCITQLRLESNKEEEDSARGTRQATRVLRFRCQIAFKQIPFGSRQKALSTETQVDSGTSQSESGTSVNLSNSEILAVMRLLEECPVSPDPRPERSLGNRAGVPRS